MKKTIYLSGILTATLLIAGCNQVSYEKTKSGLTYKLFQKGNEKDSLIKDGNVVKFHFVRIFNDSVLYDSHDKMPGFTQVQIAPNTEYSLIEILPKMRKGDSAVTIEMVDTLLKKGYGPQLPPTAKNGDRITTRFRIVEVFSNDSLAMADYNAEMLKDKPRQQKEMEEQRAKAEQETKQQVQKDWEEMVKSGEVDKGIKEMETYLAAKKINAQKTGNGVFVVIKQQGDGPAAETGKFVTIKYSGRRLATDSVFQANSYTFQLGMGNVIKGWDDGLKLFKKGGKGTLYIPGFMSYGKNPPPNSPFKPFEPLIFDVELVEVTDTMPQQ